MQRPTRIPALARFLKKRLSSAAGALTLSGLTDGDIIEAQAHNPKEEHHS